MLFYYYLSIISSSHVLGDLEFDYLHNFGPRFKKLADMYGEQPDSGMVTKHFFFCVTFSNLKVTQGIQSIKEPLPGRDWNMAAIPACNGTKNSKIDAKNPK